MGKNGSKMKMFSKEFHFELILSPACAKNFRTIFFPRKAFKSISSIHAAVSSCKNVFIEFKKPHFPHLSQKPQNKILSNEIV